MAKKTIIIILTIWIAFSCKEQESKFTDDELLIPVPATELYIRVRGNPDGPLLLNLHGGPGGYSGIDIKLMGPGLEDKYLVAYLDQRGCGKSPACTDKSLLTISQYLEDLDIVIDSLLENYQKKEINMIGTSWGGMYGFLYLLKSENKVNAFACIDGKVNSNYQNNFLLNFQTSKVNKLLQSKLSDKRKMELKVIADELNRIRNSDKSNFYKDVNWMLHEVSPKLGFNAYFVDTSKIISLDNVLEDKALLHLMKYSEKEYLEVGTKAEFVNQAFLNGNEYNDINIENSLSLIKIPVAVIQGEQDYVVGTGHAELIYKALTSIPNTQKELHILPNTGHCPAIECPDKLASVLIDFFDKHTNYKK